MSQLTDKYGDVYILAEKLGVTNLDAQENDGHLTITGSAPNEHAINQLWDKVKQIDPGMSSGDLTINVTAQNSDIYGEYEVQSGDTLSSIAKNVTGGKLTYQQIFEANRGTLSDPDKIQAGQKIKIPKF